MLWNLKCPVELSQYVLFSIKEVWRNLDGPSKHKGLWNYVVSFEFSRPKVAQIGPSRSPYVAHMNPEKLLCTYTRDGRSDRLRPSVPLVLMLLSLSSIFPIMLLTVPPLPSFPSCW